MMEDSNIRIHLGARIRELREARGLSLRDLAELAGVNHNNISAIERGKYNARIDTIERLAECLGVKLDIINN